MDLMLSFFFIYLALNMSMLVTNCIKFDQPIFFLSCSVLSKGRSRFLFEREVTTLKHLCGMAAKSQLVFNIKDNIFKPGQFDCLRLPLAVLSLTTFNKTYNSFHTPVTLPQVKCPSIWSP